MMGKISATILGAIIGGFSAVAAMVFYFGWGVAGQGHLAHVDPTRGDYVDLLLTLVTIFLAAVGLVVTVGALVIGLVALKTLREIKLEAAASAKIAAAAKITETMDAELEPNVEATVKVALPPALRSALAGETGHKVLTDMAQSGALDKVLERVVARLQSGGIDVNSEDLGDEVDQA